MIRRIVIVTLGIIAAVGVILAAQTPLTPLMNLRGTTDSNGYLRVIGAVASGAQTPLTPLGNLRGITDSTGALYVTMTGGTSTPSTVQAGDGSASAPSYSFAASTGAGMYRQTTANSVALTASGSQVFLTSDPGSGTRAVVADLGWTATSNMANNPVADTVLSRAAAGKLTLTGTGAGSAVQIRTTQGTVPTCSSNCGTSPSVTGTDTSMTITMGATGTPASGWVVTFNGTWAGNPQCSVFMAKAGMAAGKMPLTVVTTTTTMTVVTNGTAPANSDVYTAQCQFGG